MQSTTLDERRLNQALEAAHEAIGLSDPNPRVGCVIGRADGSVLGIGSTQQAGGPHAEVMALRDAQANAMEVGGATAWVTLEPCSHHGRTPPCCDALIAAGIARVVIAGMDPNPQVAGQGIARLRLAGVQVDLAQGDVVAAARDLNIGFFSRHERGKPWVRLKSAISLDGRVALPDGSSQWITGPEARADGHAWRRRAGAIMTGIGTVIADDPRLDVRLVETHSQPLRVVLDSSLRCPVEARILKPPGQTLLLAASAEEDRARKLRAVGAEVNFCGTVHEKVDLVAALKELASREVNELHVEAGPGLSGALVRAGLVDELLTYVAPMLIGPGLGLVHWPVLTGLEQAARFRFLPAVAFGSDMRMRARKVAS